jgi:hypothetical protein
MRALAFLLISAAVLGCACGGHAPAGISQHEPWYTQGDPDKRPFASRKNTMITLSPSKAAFEIPKDWVEWYDKFGNNLHLTRQEIDAAARGDGEWYTEFASVCNAALPFDHCSAHVGLFGWPKASAIDLQVRVYDLEEEENAVASRIKDAGIADIKRFSGSEPVLKQESVNSWQRIFFSFNRSYGDYFGTAHVDFRQRRFENRTFVFVFMYIGEKNDMEKEIASILASFEVP